MFKSSVKRFVTFTFSLKRKYHVAGLGSSAEAARHQPLIITCGTGREMQQVQVEKSRFVEKQRLRLKCPQY